MRLASLALTALTVWAAAWQPTDQSRALARLVEETFRRMRLTRDQFADFAGLTVKQLSDQLTQKQPMNLWRLANVEGFTRMFCQVLAETEGLLVLDKSLVVLHVARKPNTQQEAR